VGANDLEIQRLKELLKDRDPEIRRDAVYSLMGIEDRSISIPLLIEAFDDRDWRVRKSAIEVILGIRGEEVIQALIDTLYSENANQRNSAIEALIALETEATGHLIKAFETDDRDVRKFIIDIFGMTGDVRAMPVFKKAIHDEDENIQAAAVEHLGNMKAPDVVDTLLSVLKGDNLWLSFHAIEALGKIGDERAVDTLVSLLSEKPLRKAVIKALGEIGRPDSLPDIAPYLKDESRSVREQALLSIMKYYQKPVDEELIINAVREAFGDDYKELYQYASGERKELRKAATLILSLLKDRASIVHILEMASDIEQQDREIFIKAIEFVGRTSPEMLLPFFESENAYEKRVLCEVAIRTGSDIYFSHLLDLLKDEDGHVRGAAAVALSKLKNLQAVDHIVPLLKDEYENVQQEAILALSELKEGLNVDDVIAWLSGDDPVLRKNAAILLKNVGGERAIRPLGVALKDSDVGVRMAAVEAIGRINGEESVKYLLLALTDESPEVRRSSALALGGIPSDRCIESLVLLLSDPDIWVREAAIRALAELKDRRAIRHLIDQLSDDSGIIRLAAIEALGGFSDEEVKKALLPLLKDHDPEIRGTAVESLGHYVDIIEDLKSLLKDEDWSVRKRVVDVIGRSFKEANIDLLREISLNDNDPEVRDTAKRYLNG